MKKLCLILFVGIIAFCSLALYAHSGRTDSSGGHNNRKTGGYHYHNSGRSPSTPTRTTPKRTTPKPVRRKRTPPKPKYTPPPKPIAPKAPPVKPAPVKIKPASVTENHWQVALNNKVYKGQLEAPIPGGRVDILTDRFAIEVDKVSKYVDGVEQALRYANATGKKPVLALYIDGEKNGYELYKKADKLCKDVGVSLVLINSRVSVNDLVALVFVPISDSAESSYWLNTNTDARHNSSCRYYNNTKGGRECSRSEGKACGICGG